MSASDDMPWLVRREVVDKCERFWIKCDPAMFNGATEYPVTMPKKRLRLKQPAVPRAPATLGDEVDLLVKEWYAALGQPVPAEEVGVGALIDAADAARAREESAAVAAGEAAAEAAPAGEKPEYGTPEFWVWARKRRAEKNAERAAKGLPPLPTAKEKAAAAAAKAAALATPPPVALSCAQ